MKISKKIFGLVLLTITNSVYANSFFMSGEKLYTLMSGNSLSQIEAINYIMGVTDAMMPVVCSSKQIIVKQIVDSTKKMLEQNPKHLNRNASDFIILVLNKEYSCKNPETPKEKPKYFEDRLQRPRPQILI